MDDILFKSLGVVYSSGGMTSRSSSPSSSKLRAKLSLLAFKALTTKAASFLRAPFFGQPNHQGPDGLGNGGSPLSMVNRRSLNLKRMPK